MNNLWLKQVAISLVGLGLGLGFCEVAVRVLDLAPEVFQVSEGRFRLAENLRLGYELVPNFAARQTGPMRDFPEQSNNLGFRDRNHEVDKPADTFRIMVLGDSITQGMFIAEQRDVFTAVMEQELLTGGAVVEVLNFGVNGYNTRQEVETLRVKGLPYEPDLVILAYCLNDVFVDSGGILNDLRRKRESRPQWKLNPTLAKSHFCRLVWAVYLNSVTSMPPPGGLPQASSTGIVPEALSDLNDLADEHGFAVLVAGFPFLDGLPADANPHTFAEVRQWSDEHGFGMLDLTPALVEACGEGKIAIDPLHPNERGHRFVGQALAKVVQAEYLP